METAKPKELKRQGVDEDEQEEFIRRPTQKKRAMVDLEEDAPVDNENKNIVNASAEKPGKLKRRVMKTR